MSGASARLRQVGHARARSSAARQPGPIPLQRSNYRLMSSCRVRLIIPIACAKLREAGSDSFNPPLRPARSIGPCRRSGDGTIDTTLHSKIARAIVIVQRPYLRVLVALWLLPSSNLAVTVLSG